MSAIVNRFVFSDGSHKNGKHAPKVVEKVDKPEILCVNKQKMKTEEKWQLWCQLWNVHHNGDRRWLETVSLKNAPNELDLNGLWETGKRYVDNCKKLASVIASKTPSFLHTNYIYIYIFHYNSVLLSVDMGCRNVTWFAKTLEMRRWMNPSAAGLKNQRQWKHVIKVSVGPTGTFAPSGHR